MERRKNVFFIDELSKAFNIPLIYGDENGLIKIDQPFDFSGKENQYSYIANRLMKKLGGFDAPIVFYDINKYLVLIGIVCSKNEGHTEFVLVGPLASSVTSDESINQYLVDSGLSIEGVKTVSEYLKNNKTTSFQQFISILSSINLFMNGETWNIDKFHNLSKSDEAYQKLVSAPQRIKAIDLDEEDKEHNKVISDELEKKLHFCMKNGLVELIPSILDKMQTITFDDISNPYFTDKTKNLRIVTIGALFSAHTTALNAGVPAKTIDNLKYYYLNLIDAANTIERLHTIQIDILFEFTKAIRDNRTFSTDNPTVNRVIQYIQSNISSKLTVPMISKALHVSENYIFTRFKKEMNMTVLEYITLEKLKKAEYYLLFTDKSLLEISIYLGFSSQSYFQTVFKKVKNVTPSKFRESGGR